MIEQPLLLTGWSSRFLIYDPLPNTVSYATLGTLQLTVQSFCDIQDARPHQWSPSASQPTLSRKTEDILRSGRYPKDAPLPTFLAYLQPV